MAGDLLAGRAPLKVATRRSDLALTQSAQTVALIAERCGVPGELVPMASTGDLHPERALNAFGTKGIFLDSLREALLAGEVDLAIHSFKDVPTDPTPGLAITAIPPRADGRDVLATREGLTVDTLPEGAKVGTSSARRGAQLAALRPDLEIQPIRGNVPTRIGRIHKDLDAVILAGAGLARLQAGRPGVEPVLNGIDFAAQPIPVTQMVPAPAQGVLAIEHREDDTTIRDALMAIHDPASARAAEIERGILAQMGGGCSIPLGVYAALGETGAATVEVFLGASENQPAIRLTEVVDADAAVAPVAQAIVARLKGKDA